MNLSAGRRTWEEAASPAAVRLARKYEQAWRDSDPPESGRICSAFLGEAGESQRRARRPVGVAARRHGAAMGERARRSAPSGISTAIRDLGEDTIVALVYEEFCLAKKTTSILIRAEYLARFPQVAAALGRVFQIHDLVGSGTTVTALPLSTADGAAPPRSGFPGSRPDDRWILPGRRAGSRGLCSRFSGPGAPARRSAGGAQGDEARLARAADAGAAAAHPYRAGAFPSDRRGDRPSSPVHALLRAAHAGAVARRPEVQSAQTGAVLLAALDRLEPADELPAGRAAGREALASANLRPGRSRGGGHGLPRRSNTPTIAAFCTATSSPRTCW